MNFGSVVNGWVAAAGGMVVIILAVGALTQRWHEIQVRKLLAQQLLVQRDLLREVREWKTKKH